MILDLSRGLFQTKRKKIKRLERKKEEQTMKEEDWIDESCRFKYKSYSLSKFHLKRGNIYDYLDKETYNWLIDEAIACRVDNLGIIVAAIVKDAKNEKDKSG